LPLTITVRLSAGLTHRELGFLAFRHVTFRTRESRPYQPAVHRPVIVASCVVIRNPVGVTIRRRIAGGRDSDLDRRTLRAIDTVRRVIAEGFASGAPAGRRDGAGTGVFDSVRGECSRLLAAQRRRLPLLVFVLGIARGAPRLPDIVLDHGDDDVIGDAALARTVVVQNVTEPKPALLHESPGTFLSVLGIGKRAVI